MTELRIGTSAFTAAGWLGSFYPKGTKPKDFLTYYATKFSTVEIDSTFYHAPAPSFVSSWADKTPESELDSRAAKEHRDCLLALVGILV
jgi:uncharacterized protein YecE (DUF72 family)